ncbi:Hypothetical protein GSB_155095 [Giardia duodenalis]|uniref:Uncharacterized protein n=1 Tax=Giardia intestinalis TaxID=5741 RepID=V6TQW9_GIAIN|nr:Hypothetical protein GSB_155095 [Giardia intestinalis]
MFFQCALYRDAAYIASPAEALAHRNIIFCLELDTTF